MREARLKAAEWEMNHRPASGAEMTVQDAVRAYLDSKENVLSPSTLRSYEGILRTHIKDRTIGGITIATLTVADVQRWVNVISGDHTPKTARNCFGLLQAAVKLQDPKKDISAALPAPVRFENYCPSDGDIKALIAAIEKDDELLIAVYLGAFGLMRRGEICSLESSDLHGNAIHVSKSMVKDPDGEWVVKAPKTYESDRYVELPSFIIDKLKEKTGPYITCTPNALSARFNKAVAKAGIPRFRFHDLRHYGASIMHAIGVPDVYIMQYGGWSSDHVMKRVYRNSIEEEKKKQTDKIKAHFAGLLQN
jgi:integrase